MRDESRCCASERGGSEEGERREVRERWGAAARAAGARDGPRYYSQIPEKLFHH